MRRLILFPIEFTKNEEKKIVRRKIFTPLPRGMVAPASNSEVVLFLKEIQNKIYQLKSR